MDTERGVLNTGVYWGEKGRASGRGWWGGMIVAARDRFAFGVMEYSRI